MAMKFHVVVFWGVTPCSDVVGHQRFRGTCYLHCQNEANDAGKGQVVLQVKDPVWINRKSARIVILPL
jgi:hypothetical protein